MKYIQSFIVVLFFFCNTSLGQNLKYFDILRERPELKAKTTVIYLCATWCHPCIQKLDTIIRAFSARSDINFYVMLELSGYSKIYKVIENNKYDSSLFRLMSPKYYPNSNKLIQTRLPQKAFKFFTEELRMEFPFAQDSFLYTWVGSALIFKNEKVLITDPGLDKNELISMISNSLTTNL